MIDRKGTPGMTSRRHVWLSWLLFLAVGLLLISAITVFSWRATGTGPQVQVPMFYDAHYLFPRPWTQEQAAPGVPEPSPLALYSDNQVSQTFVAGADRLSALAVLLDGADQTPVEVTLDDDGGQLMRAVVKLDASRRNGRYMVAFEPLAQAKGRRFTVTLSAPEATATEPVLTRTVGGDRLGGALRLNDFSRPGNLVLYTYSRGLPGSWWLDAIGEQLLPAAFRLRLQQYKPVAFKGALFSWLLLLTAGSSALLLVLASPGRRTAGYGWAGTLARATGWFLAISMGVFLVWQLASGRATAGSDAAVISGHNGSARIPASTGSGPLLFADLSSDLWTAQRRPEARFVQTTHYIGFPAIRVPPDSRIDYAVNAPPGSLLHFATAVEGDGVSRFAILVDEQLLYETSAPTSDALEGNAGWQEIALPDWATGGVTLSLITSSDSPDIHGLWLMPQLLTNAEWLLSSPPPESAFLPARVHFNESVELLGVESLSAEPSGGESLPVRLLWRADGRSSGDGKVFVHLLNADGQIIGQHDSHPLEGTYPFPEMRPGAIVVDEHELVVASDPGPGPYRLAVGIYDPVSLERWAAVDNQGRGLDDGRALIDLPDGEGQ